MNDNLNLNLIKPNNKVLDGLPLFYNYIYFNKIVDRKEEDKYVFVCKNVEGLFTYSTLPKLISTIIDFSCIDNKSI
jgi:hypothetical protein